MIRVTAYAKINLFLEITGMRSDGYHTLSTVFQTISLGDKLSFHPAEKLSLTCSDSSLPTDERNLVMTAAMRLRETLKETRGAKIHLEKIVPMGAGLGGGSSDAAATLSALLRLWKRPLSPKPLASLAVEIGADVPFFLKGGLCLASGIGEKLKPLTPLPKMWLVLVYPGFGVATKEAYSRVRLPFKDRRTISLKRILSSFPAASNGESMDPSPTTAGDDGQKLFNRFENLVFPDHPDLPRLKQALLDAGATSALMSGSGSSVFGLAPSRLQGGKILAALRPRYPQSWLVHSI